MLCAFNSGLASRFGLSELQHTTITGGGPDRQTLRTCLKAAHPLLCQLQGQRLGAEARIRACKKTRQVVCSVISQASLVHDKTHPSDQRTSCPATTLSSPMYHVNLLLLLGVELEVWLGSREYCVTSISCARR